MQHNYESQDGDGEPNGGTKEQAEVVRPQVEGLPVMRRVHSYSGAGAGVEGRAGISEPGSWDEAGYGNGFTLTPLAPNVGIDGRAVSTLRPSFGADVSSTETNLPPRSTSMHAIPSFGSRAADPSISAAATGLLVGPSIPLALRRASSDQYPGGGEAGGRGVESDAKGKDRGFASAAVQSAGWTTPASGTGKSPSTPPKGSATFASAAMGTMSFNSGSPSNHTQGSSMMMSTTPVRSSAGMGLRARANSGTRLRSASGTFGVGSFAFAERLSLILLSL